MLKSLISGYGLLLHGFKVLAQCLNTNRILELEKKRLYCVVLCVGVNIGGAGSYVYDTPVGDDSVPVAMETKPKAEEKKATRGPVKGEFV